VLIVFIAFDRNCKEAGARTRFTYYSSHRLGWFPLRAHQVEKIITARQGRFILSGQGRIYFWEKFAKFATYVKEDEGDNLACQMIFIAKKFMLQFSPQDPDKMSRWKLGIFSATSPLNRSEEERLSFFVACFFPLLRLGCHSVSV